MSRLQAAAAFARGSAGVGVSGEAAGEEKENALHRRDGHWRLMSGCWSPARYIASGS